MRSEKQRALIIAPWGLNGPETREIEPGMRWITAHVMPFQGRPVAAKV